MKDQTRFQAISVLLAKKAHLEIMQEKEKERQKAVSQKIIKKDTGRSF